MIHRHIMTALIISSCSNEPELKSSRSQNPQGSLSGTKDVPITSVDQKSKQDDANNKVNTEPKATQNPSLPEDKTPSPDNTDYSQKIPEKVEYSGKKVLLIGKTLDYVHASTPKGKQAIKTLLFNEGVNTIISDDTSILLDKTTMNSIDAIIFLNTSGEILNEEEKTAFKNFYKNAKGFVGIHAATDTLRTWPWYNELVGAYAKDHPDRQNATVKTKTTNHHATASLQANFKVFDEWYNFNSIKTGFLTLQTVDEKSYTGGTMGENHPITWCRDFDGGRSFYTGMGHTDAIYANPEFLKIVWNGIRYAISQKAKCTK